MTREEIRRENARRLAEKAGGKAEFARILSMEPSQVSQIIGPKPSKNIGNSIAKRIESAFDKAAGYLDSLHTDDESERYPRAPALTLADEDSPFFDAPSFRPGMGVRVSEGPATVPIRAVKLKLQAGVSGFVAEPDMDIDHGYFDVPASVIDELRLNPVDLLIMSIKGRSMEPMMFEDDMVLVDTSKRTPINNECFAVNWNGEPLVKCLIKKQDSWALYSMNRDPKFHTIDVRTGQCSIIGLVVWQPARIVTGRI